MQQQQSHQDSPQAKPQWEAPVLQQADVSATTMAGVSINNLDGPGTYSS